MSVLKTGLTLLHPDNVFFQFYPSKLLKGEIEKILLYLSLSVYELKMARLYIKNSAA